MDYWVARALGYRQSTSVPDDLCGISEGFNYSLEVAQWEPSKNWFQAGPIIERSRIELKPIVQSGEMWLAGKHKTTDSLFFSAQHPLVAAMRCFVMSKFGEYVGDD